MSSSPPSSLDRVFCPVTVTTEENTFDPVYYFGCEPIPEESYENNEKDFIVQ